MTIILEGCDCTGKTTLANMLIEKYKLKYYHVTSKDKNDYKFYSTSMKIENIIYDRHLLGEMIYPTVYKREGNLNDTILEKLLEEAKEQKVVILVLTEDDKIIFERIKNERPFEDEQTKNNITFINSSFVKLAKKYNLPLIRKTQMSFEEICEVIENEYKR